MTFFTNRQAEQALYLERISYAGDLLPKLCNLHSLQQAHLLSVPFENLDIHSGISIKLDIPAIFDKIVHRRRGGFCYEVNGLFWDLLVTLGFDVDLISARVYNEKKGYGLEFAHMALLVTIDQKQYLCDVGFGEFAFAPLQISETLVQQDKRGDFTIEKMDDETLLVSLMNKDNSTPQYLFTLIPRQYHEFNDMCVYQQTSVHSHFTQKRLITQATTDGRVTLTGDVLKIDKNGQVTETLIADTTEMDQVLLANFGVTIAN